MSNKCPFKAEAKRLGKKTYRNGVLCPKGHSDIRSVNSGGCVECARQNRRKYYHQDSKNRDKAREEARRRRAADPVAERQRAVRVLLKSKYDMTESDYADLYVKQSGRCAVCGSVIVSRLDESRPLYSGSGAPTNELGRVDHCHSTGKVRGLLCSNCNTLLGKAKDDEQILLNAVRYLRESRNRTEESRSDREKIQGEICAAGERDHNQAGMLEEHRWLH